MKTRTSRSSVAGLCLSRTLPRWVLAVAGGGLVCCVLSFYQASDAAPPSGNQPFANSVQQRMDMIGELTAIHALMKEQNALLKEQNVLLRSLAAAAGGAPAKRPER